MFRPYLCLISQILLCWKCEKGFAVILIVSIVLAAFVLGVSIFLKQQKLLNIPNLVVVHNKTTPKPSSSVKFTDQNAKGNRYVTGKYEYELINKTVKISDPYIVHSLYADNPYITLGAQINRVNLSTNATETVVKPLPNDVLGKIDAPSGCCLIKYNIIKYQPLQNDLYLFFIRDKFYIVDLTTMNISQILTNYPEAYALNFQISPDERYIFLQSGDRHSFTYQEIIDLKDHMLYRLPTGGISINQNTYQEFAGFSDAGQIVLLVSSGNQPANTGQYQLVNLTTFPSKSYTFLFAQQ